MLSHSVYRMCRCNSSWLSHQHQLLDDIYRCCIHQVAPLSSNDCPWSHYHRGAGLYTVYIRYIYVRSLNDYRDTEEKDRKRRKERTPIYQSILCRSDGRSSVCILFFTALAHCSQSVRLPACLPASLTSSLDHTHVAPASRPSPRITLLLPRKKRPRQEAKTPTNHPQCPARSVVPWTVRASVGWEHLRLCALHC